MQPTLSEQLQLFEAHELLVRLSRDLYERGYSVGGAGNISVRRADGKIVLTNSGSSLGRLRVEELALVEADGTQISGGKPTKEMGMHLAIYAAKPEVGAIVHLHSTALTALSCLQGLDPENVIRPFTPYVVMRLGKIPLVRYFPPGSQELVDAVAQRTPQAKALLLANHGVIVCGKDLQDAVDNAQELEETAKLFFMLRNSDINYFSDAQIAQLLQRKL